MISKVTYDPFLIFKPSKAFLKDKINELTYELERLENATNSAHAYIYFWDRAAEYGGYTKMVQRIRNYQWRIRNAGKGSEARHNIGPAEISRAKQADIKDYYTGKLRRSGKTWIGLCPFHTEHTGSFTIHSTAEEYRFHCFSCGQDGDCIDFIRKINNLNFLQAIRWILQLQ